MALTEEDFVGDLEITMEAPFAVYPAEPTPRRSMFLSNIDETLVSTVATITFFPACPHMSFDEVVQRYVDALGKLLVHYDFVAGRLTLNEDDEQFEIDCDGAGVFFAVGTSDLAMEELKDIKFPNPAFRQLILEDYVSCSHLQDLPLLTRQGSLINAFLDKGKSCKCPAKEDKVATLKIFATCKKRKVRWKLLRHLQSWCDEVFGNCLADPPFVVSFK